MTTPDEPLTLTTQRDDTTVVITATGEIDASTQPLLAGALREALHDAPTADVVLDLSDVAFIDSSGLHALLHARTRHGERFRLGGVSTVVARLLELTGMTRTFAGPSPQPAAGD